jgi:hypothetical protein
LQCFDWELGPGNGSLSARERENNNSLPARRAHGYWLAEYCFIRQYWNMSLQRRTYLISKLNRQNQCRRYSCDRNMLLGNLFCLVLGQTLAVEDLVAGGRTSTTNVPARFNSSTHAQKDGTYHEILQHSIRPVNVYVRATCEMGSLLQENTFCAV